jgi:hypothetical protein
MTRARRSSPSELLVTLGMVNVNWNENHDPVANFVPFVAQILKESTTDVVALGDVQANVNGVFGLEIPQGALMTILRRAAREGYLTISSGVYRPEREALEAVDFDVKRSEVKRDQDVLIRALRTFAGERYRQEWSEEQAGAALLRYVQDQAAPILMSAVRGQEFQLVSPVKHSEVIVHGFVLSLYETDPEDLARLETFVKGTMLANILFLPEGFGDVDRKFGPTEFFLDTPLVLLAIGYAKEEVARPAVEMLELLQAYSAELRIFDHTLREIEGVLDGAAMALRKGIAKKYEGSVVEYFVLEGLTSADAEMMITSLPDRLSRAGITVVDAPAQTESLAVDEARLGELLSETVTYPREETMYRDIDSLTAVHRLREGRFHSRLEACPAVFVTTNFGLVRGSRKFFREVYDRSTVPVCILDHALTTIVWLKDPARAADLPRRQMVADSFAAMNPPDALWQRYVAEIDRLEERSEISEEEFALLRYSMDARRALMDLTLGDEDVFTTGTISQVLEYARQRAARDAKVEGERAAEERQRARYRDVANRTGTYVAWFFFGLAALALIVGAVVATAGPLGDVPALLRAVLSACVLFGAIFGIANGVFDVSVRTAAARLEKGTAKFVDSRLRSFFSPDRDESQ